MRTPHTLTAMYRPRGKQTDESLGYYIVLNATRCLPSSSEIKAPPAGSSPSNCMDNRSCSSAPAAPLWDGNNGFGVSEVGSCAFPVRTPTQTVVAVPFISPFERMNAPRHNQKEVLARRSFGESPGKCHGLVATVVWRKLASFNGF